MSKPKRKLIPEALDKIKQYESLRLFAYPDPGSPLHEETRHLKLGWGFRPAGEILAYLAKNHPQLSKLSGTPWTCGYGSTRGVTQNTVWTEAEALDALDRDLDVAQCDVEKSVKVELTDYQYGALVSLVFNIGGPNFFTSTLLKQLNRGEYLKAADRFEDWIKRRNRKTGKLEVMPGLKTRRAVEKAFFLRGMFVESNTLVPEEDVPEAERPVSKDPSVALPAATATGGTLLVLTEAASQIKPLAEASDSLRTVFVVLVLVGVVLTLYLNMKKRKEKRS